jgi:colanic acid/amylovoran biosynthesis glycosyltransferase
MSGCKLCSLKNVNILYITGAYPVSSETFVVRMIQGIENLGHSVKLAAFARGDDQEQVKTPLKEVVYLGEGKMGRWARVAQALRLIIFGGPSMLSMIRALWVGIRDPASRYITYLILADGISRLGDCDLIHAQFGGVGRVMLKLKKAGIINRPMVVSFRGQDSSELLRRHPGIYREIYEVGDAFLPVSREVLETHRSEGCSPDKLQVHRSCLPLSEFPFTPGRGCLGKEFLAVGRLVEKKGFSVLVQALKLLQDRGVTFRARIIGEGKDRPELQRLINEFGMGLQVELLGQKSQSEVRQWMIDSDILVVPSKTDSRGDKEGIPNVIKEAMALGTAVVASRHGGIPELVEDGVTGFLIEENNAHALASCLSSLVCAPIPETLLVNARRKIESEYSSQTLSIELENIYSRVLST